MGSEDIVERHVIAIDHGDRADPGNPQRSDRRVSSAWSSSLMMSVQSNDLRAILGHPASLPGPYLQTARPVPPSASSSSNSPYLPFVPAAGNPLYRQVPA